MNLSAPGTSMFEVGRDAVQTGNVLLNFLFPSDEISTESIEPSVGPLDHAMPCLLDLLPPSGFRFIAA